MWKLVFSVFVKVYHIQVYLRNIVGLVLDHCSTASLTGGRFYLQFVKSTTSLKHNKRSTVKGGVAVYVWGRGTLE